MQVYQLHASGPGQVLDGYRKMVSKKVFLNKEDAKKHIPEFKENCTTFNFKYIDAIDPKHCKIQIAELELVKGEE